MNPRCFRILSGEITLPAAGRDLLDLVVRTAAGAPGKPVALGHREYFVMYKHQSTPALAAGCHA